jgi:eukaryotic-like serine/threonine-protein kinase
MGDGLDKPRVQADHQSIAIGEINIHGTVTGNIHIGHTIIQAADARLRRDLGILLKNVETTWIKGVLEKSVHQAALLELGMEVREEAVDNPWRMVMEKPDQSHEVLPPGRNIKDIFDEANRLLLILGEPGSGKTTTLLQLARDLIAEVDEAFTRPIPVILNLSTWTNKQQPLAEWLVAEMNSKYRLPKRDGKKWLQDGRILPLLDGLDEVRAENRVACVEKINQLATQYGLQGMAVCSRIKDYTDLNVRLAFYRAIYVQPLPPEQVDEYLERAGDKLSSLRATLQADEALRNMAQSPLILNIMSLAYQNASAEDLTDPALNTNKARRKHLLDTYIARMFHRKASAQPYDDHQTKQRLVWLAQNMQKHNQEVFLMEGLQPNWLQSRGWWWLYFLSSRLVCGMIFGVSLGRIAAPVWILGQDVWMIIRQVMIWLPIGLIAGLAVGLIDAVRFEWFQKRKGMKYSSTFWRTVISMVVVSLIVGLFVSLVVGRIYDELIIGILVGTSAGLFYGFVFGIRGGRQSPGIDIETVEALRWNWHRGLRGGLMGGLIGLMGGLITGFSFLVLRILLDSSGISEIILSVLYSGLRAALFLGVIGVILSGIRREIIETKSAPNQGVRLSLRNAIFGGLIFGTSIGLLYGLLFSFSDGLSDGLLYIITFTLMAALWYGGFDAIQHYVLRLILILQGHTPRNYAHFLDYTVERIFLQKVGGGYRFIHRLLLEHFAEMYETNQHK